MAFKRNGLRGADQHCPTACERRCNEEDRALVGGMVLMLAMLRPLLSLSFDLPALDGESYREAVEALKETLSAEQEDALRERIAAQTQAYIEDKAASLGLNVRAEVRTAIYDGVPLPDSATLYGEKTRRSARTSRRSLA